MYLYLAIVFRSHCISKPCAATKIITTMADDFKAPVIQITREPMQEVVDAALAQIKGPSGGVVIAGEGHYVGKTVAIAEIVKDKANVEAQYNRISFNEYARTPKDELQELQDLKPIKLPVMKVYLGRKRTDAKGWTQQDV